MTVSECEVNGSADRGFKKCVQIAAEFYVWLG